MIKWRESPKGQGILIAADEKLEWLLPWWWARYSEKNAFPVACIDFGMSHYGKTFWENKGLLLPLSFDSPLIMESDQTKFWQKEFGKALLDNRPSWFKKPFAFLSTPFERTLWLDLDCEVLQPLQSLFELEGEIYLAKETENSLKRERSLQIILEDEMLFNSGVVLYSQGNSVIEKWTRTILEQGSHFPTDQHALSRLIHTEQIPISILHENYNWRMSQGLNLQASIIHWVGSWGKEYIQRYGGITPFISEILSFPHIYD